MNAVAGQAFDVQSVRLAMREVEAKTIEAQMFPASGEFPDAFPEVGTRLRMRRRGEADPVATASLILNDEGALLWHAGQPPTAFTGRRTRRGVPEAPAGELVELYQYEPLAPNEIMQHLVNLDARLNENLVKADNAAPQLVPLTFTGGPAGDPKAFTITRGAHFQPTGDKKRLLFVHGTFSKTDAFFDGIRNASGGPAFLEKLFRNYAEVLAYDHATLSVSPVLNAFDLARLMAKAQGPLDVVAHSRGGLVTRWALEGFGLGKAAPVRGMLVGCPINGTSLAAPARLRSSLSLLSNIGTALKIAGGVASAYVPLLIAPVALLRVATSVISVAAKTPLLDAAVLMVPGLAGQSRAGNNSDIGRIRSVKINAPPKYFVVQSDFEIESPGWKFWKWFNKGRLATAGADIIFEGKNDLVVDTMSMTEFAKDTVFPPANLQDFSTNGEVHHCNYFESDKTLAFMGHSLGL
jgi:hypothetical protein